MNLDNFDCDLKEQMKKNLSDELNKNHKKFEKTYASCDLFFQLLQDCKNEYKHQSNTKCKTVIEEYKTYCM